VARGRVRLVARHADYAPATVEAEAGDAPLEIVLAGGGGIRADIRDALTLGPLAAFTVRARGPGGAELKKNGGRGEIELTPLMPGTWTLTVEAPGFATSQVEVEVPAGTGARVITVDRLRVELAQGAVVAGTVYTEHGDPVAGATVEAGLVRGTTSGTGAFRLVGVPAGQTVVRASHAQEGAAALVVPLHPGDEALTLAIRLSGATSR
jgi:hypothetical protein